MKFVTGENCQKGLQQENYLAGQTRGMTKNIGADQRDIEDDGKEEKLGEKE